MTTLKEIEERLKAYTPKTGCGDGMLNPGVVLAAPKRDAAVLILLVPQDDGSYSVLFTERTKTLHAHAGQVSFPGGGVEPQDKDVTETALREAAEEIGLKPENARVIGQLSEYITRTGFRVTPVVAILEKKQAWDPQPEEVARIFEVPLNYITAHIAQESLSFEGGERHFYGFNYDGSHIWGATAGMMHDFLDAIDAQPPANTNTPQRKNPPSAIK